MARLRITVAARNDLRDLRRHSLAMFGPAATRAYLEGLRAIFVLLETHPHAGAAEVDLGPSIRAFPYRSHRVYYRAREGETTIVRILHHARDVQRVFAPR
jgi:toxin ParE1/3/4